MENTKAKQIEAIACVLEDVCLDAKDCSLIADCDMCRAEKLYDAGCRVIGDTVIELPCKLGEDIYVIKRCHCGNPDCFKKGRCNKRRTLRSPEILERRMILERGKRFKVDDTGRVVRDIDVPVGTICYTVYKKPFTLDMIPALGKTVFVSLEDTKEALYEIWREKA